MCMLASGYIAYWTFAIILKRGDAGLPGKWFSVFTEDGKFVQAPGYALRRI